MKLLYFLYTTIFFVLLSSIAFAQDQIEPHFINQYPPNYINEGDSIENFQTYAIKTPQDWVLIIRDHKAKYHTLKVYEDGTLEEHSLFFSDGIELIVERSGLKYKEKEITIADQKFDSFYKIGRDGKASMDELFYLDTGVKRRSFLHKFVSVLIYPFVSIFDSELTKGEKRLNKSVNKWEKNIGIDKSLEKSWDSFVKEKIQ